MTKTKLEPDYEKEILNYVKSLNLNIKLFKFIDSEIIYKKRERITYVVFNWSNNNNILSVTLSINDKTGEQQKSFVYYSEPP